MQVQLQRPPKRNINWDELRRLKDSSEHVEIEIEAVNRWKIFLACDIPLPKIAGRNQRFCQGHYRIAYEDG